MIAAMQWLAVGEAAIPDGVEWLSAAEAARGATMRFTKRRTEYRLRRLAGKRAVAAALGRPTTSASLAGIEVLNRRGGAPYVVVDGIPAPLEVSLTDRAGWAVCLVGPEGELGGGTIGVDLETVEPRSRGFVSDYLTTAEQDYVRGRGEPGSEGWDVAANLLWSAKESALKVLRVGLRADTRSVEVTLEDAARPDGWAPLRVQTRFGESFPGWWRRDGVFLLTIASRDLAQPPDLLDGGDELATAEPVHSWMAKPLAD